MMRRGFETCLELCLECWFLAPQRKLKIAQEREDCAVASTRQAKAGLLRPIIHLRLRVSIYVKLTRRGFLEEVRITATIDVFELGTSIMDHPEIGWPRRSWFRPSSYEVSRDIRHASAITVSNDRRWSEGISCFLSVSVFSLMANCGHRQVQAWSVGQSRFSPRVGAFLCFERFHAVSWYGDSQLELSRTYLQINIVSPRLVPLSPTAWIGHGGRKLSYWSQPLWRKRRTTSKARHCPLNLHRTRS